MKKFAFILVILFSCASIYAEGAKYLIITRDSYYDAIQPLAQWKHKKGFPTKVVKLSEIGNDAQVIKDYIRNAYYFWQPKPEYILLVGDINQIRPYPHPECGPTDNPYGDVEDDAQQEILIGRLPARTVKQARIMVDKIFQYERTPFLVDTMWYLKATTIRQDPGPYHNAGIEFVRSMILDNSNFIQVDTLSVPMDDKRNLRDSIYQGRSYVLYTGHGGGTHWMAPFNMSPTSRNYQKLPVIFAWCCQTVLRNNYLGQKWLKMGSTKKEKGAVAYIGTTTSGLYAPYRNFVARNFFRAVFEHKVLNIGQALKQGLDSLWTYTPDSFGLKLYPEWNLLGDPEMNLWTAVPKPMTVEFDSIIQPGNQTFSISVKTQEAIPIDQAKVCLMMPADSNFYYYGQTDRFGILSFNIKPVVQDSFYLTVTAQNFVPFEAKCRVTSIENNYIQPEPKIFFNQKQPSIIK